MEHSSQLCRTSARRSPASDRCLGEGRRMTVAEERSGDNRLWEEMPEADFVGRVCALPPVSRCSADKGAPKLNPRPLACFNRFPWQEEGRWGKAHRPPRRGCPAGTERPDLELLRECSGALRQSCQQTGTCDPESRPGPNEDSSRTVSFNYSKHRVLDNY